tara:strand:- start:5325 stop:7613 length:2289 start_codon:yes stop_codon:yes gene_type:complete
MVHFYDPKPPLILQRETSLIDVFQSLQKTKLPVILLEKDFTVYGVLSSGDIGRYFSENPDISFDKAKAEDIANRQPVIAHENDDFETIASFLKKDKITLLPLVNEKRVLKKLASHEKAFLNLNGFIVTSGAKPYLVAEIGVNHNGDLNEAFFLIDEASKAGCNAVKFQHRSNILYDSAEIDSFDLGTQYIVSQIEKTKLSINELTKCIKESHKKNLDVIVTPFDQRALEELTSMNHLITAYKIASCDLGNLPLIKKVINTGKSIILSTGMSYEREILETSNFLMKNWANHAFLHCNSTYPCPNEDVRLSYIKRIEDITNTVVGYSSHDGNSKIPLASITQGASIIEFHITRFQNNSGTDHLASIPTTDLKQFVQDSRLIFDALGNPTPRKPTQGELANKQSLGKSLALKRDFKKGEIIKEEDLILISPNIGIKFEDRQEVIGKKLLNNQKGLSLLKREIFEKPILNFEKEDLEKAYKKLISLGYTPGIPVRYHDAENFIKNFNPPMVEFHMSDRDLTLHISKYIKHSYNNIDLIIHAIEQYEDGFILNFSSEDETIIKRSFLEIDRLTKHIDELRNYFKPAKKIPIVINLGGFSNHDFLSNKEKLVIFNKTLLAVEELKIKFKDYEFLPQTMPPFPWHQGGRSYHNLLVQAESIEDMINQSSLNICFDVSHTSMACYFHSEDFYHTIKKINHKIKHIHLSDARGNSEEGLEVGEGSIDFKEFHKSIMKDGNKKFLLPEIWQGHLNYGFKFATSLIRFSALID